MSAYNLTLSKTKTVLSYDAHMAKQECDWLNNNVRSSAALPEILKAISADYSLQVIVFWKLIF